MLDLLRLATNARVMQKPPIHPAEAWKIYREPPFEFENWAVIALGGIPK